MTPGNPVLRKRKELGSGTGDPPVVVMPCDTAHLLAKPGPKSPLAIRSNGLTGVPVYVPEKLKSIWPFAPMAGITAGTAVEFKLSSAQSHPGCEIPVQPVVPLLLIFSLAKNSQPGGSGLLLPAVMLELKSCNANEWIFAGVARVFVRLKSRVKVCVLVFTTNVAVALRPLPFKLFRVPTIVSAELGRDAAPAKAMNSMILEPNILLKRLIRASRLSERDPNTLLGFH